MQATIFPNTNCRVWNKVQIALLRNVTKGGMHKWLALSGRSNNEQMKSAVTVLTRIFAG
jgi:hypothetical protein